MFSRIIRAARSGMVVPACLLLTLVATVKGTTADALFNGKDLAGWKWVCEKEGVKADEVWSVNDGVLACKGKPRGYIRTEKDDYENYVLELEWRFPEGSPGGNSGVLLHTSTPNAI